MTIKNEFCGLLNAIMLKKKLVEEDLSLLGCEAVSLGEWFSAVSLGEWFSTVSLGEWFSMF